MRRSHWSHALKALSTIGVLAASGASCDGRPFGAKLGDGESLSGPAIVEINLSRGAPETGRSTLFGSTTGESHADLVRVLSEIDRKETKGIFVRLGTTHVSFAIAHEVGGMLAELRKDLTVVCHADDLDNSTMLLSAMGCSEIWVSAAGGVDTVGIAAQLLYGKTLLDKIGVGVDFLQVGKYKGAQETYTRSEPSPEARESLEGTLRDLRKAWIAGINEGRDKDLTVAVEDGPFAANDAVKAGLVDKVGYADEARSEAKRKAGAERSTVIFGGRKTEGGASQLLRGLAGGDATTRPHVAVVRAVGAITMGGGGLLGGGDGITERGLGKMLNDLREDDAVKAVVLRIDSPGGSALASDLLWHKLMKLREKKPLIISVGGMAASGGYYLSCAGERIFAEPTSIVGSIGVVGGKFALHDPLFQIGINAVTVPASPDPERARRASYMSQFERWDDATRAKVLTSMEAIYTTFLDRIEEGRGLPRATIEQAAEGRIFGGATAKDMKLVDEMGGLRDAIAYALNKANLGADGEVLLAGETSNVFDQMLEGDSASAAEAFRSKVAAATSLKGALEDAIPAYALEFLASAAPIAEGERCVAALPFALNVR
jgi:protease IV